MTFKRICVSLCTIMICITMFLSGYMKIATIYSYADDVTDEWENVTTNAELVEAFRYYCKSRDLTIDGSIANGVTQFTTKSFNGICNTLGIDMTAIQANIKYNVDSNGIKRFLFTNDIISTYNRIFAQFLQDNDLEVGDSANEQDNTVYSGYIYTDADGINTLVWIVSSTSVNANANVPNQYIAARGTYYKYNQDTLMALVPNLGSTTTTFKLTSNTTFTGRIRHNISETSTVKVDNYDFYQNGSTVNSKYIGGYSKVISSGKITTYSGYPCIFYDTTSRKFYMGVYGLIQYSDNSTSKEAIGNLLQFNVTNSNYQSANVYLTTNNTVINNNNYEGDTIINNYGTPSSPTPTDPEYDPYPNGGGTITDPHSSGGGSGEDDTTITFPDFNFDFPSIDWSLGDLSEKFPFSIPFDLIAFFTVLNAEPQAPEIDTDIPLGTWYTWHFEADFSQFDNYAVIIRNVEFIGFCVALIYLTIRLVKG